MTDDTPAQPKPVTKRRKGYHLCTYISDDAGRFLDQMTQNRGLTRTAWIEMMIRDQARKEGIKK